MKSILRYIIAAALIISAGSVTSAQSDDNDYLTQIPQIPTSITNGSERCNYVVNHYWDHFNYKSAFSAKKRMHNTVGRFFDFVPCATADTVFMAIDELIKGVSKTKADNLLELCKMAEFYTQGDSAEYPSDDLFYPFVSAVANNKKIKSAEKLRYNALYKIMTNSRRGAVVSELPMTRPDGTKATIADIKAPHVLLMFVDPGCVDCSLAKARLSADYVVEALVKAKVLDIVAIYPGDADDAEWLTEATTMPDGWIVAACPEADTLFDIPSTPTIYYLNTDRKVAAKNIQVDNILRAFHQLVENASATGAEQAQPTETQSTSTDQ